MNSAAAVLRTAVAAQEGATAVGEISGWTTRLSARAQDLESKLARFFSRLRAASGYARPLLALILKRPLLRPFEGVGAPICCHAREPHALRGSSA